MRNLLAYPTDLRAPGAIDQLIAYHRHTFGGFCMEDDGGTGGDGGGGASGGDGQGGGGQGNTGGGHDNGNSGQNNNTDDDHGGDGEGPDKGFPADTPVAQMTVEQQAAYWRHTSRKHEERATEYRTAAGGKTAAEVKSELESASSLRREKLSDQEKAVEDAKAAGRKEAEAEYGPRMARLAFESVLGHIEDEKERTELIDTLDLSKVLQEGSVDTAKVRRIAARIAPAGKDEGGRRTYDFGGGHKDTKVKTGVTAGADLFDASRKKTSTTNGS